MLLPVFFFLLSLITETLLSGTGHPGSLCSTVAQFMCKCQVLADPCLGPSPCATKKKKGMSRLLWDSGEGTIAAAYGTGQWAAICWLPQSFAA